MRKPEEKEDGLTTRRNFKKSTLDTEDNTKYAKGDELLEKLENVGIGRAISCRNVNQSQNLKML